MQLYSNAVVSLDKLLAKAADGTVEVRKPEELGFVTNYLLTTSKWRMHHPRYKKDIHG